MRTTGIPLPPRGGRRRLAVWLLGALLCLVLPLLSVGHVAFSEAEGGSMSLREAQAIAAANSALLDMLEAQLDAAEREELEAVLNADLVPPDAVVSYELALLKYLGPEQATVERRLAAEKLRGARANLDLTVASAYFGVLTAERFADLALEAHARSTDQVRLSRQLEEAGMVAHKDVLDAIAQEAEAAAGLAGARRAVDAAQLGLLRLLGDGRSESPRLDPASLVDDEAEPGVAEAVALALEQRFEVQQAEEYEDLARRNLELAQVYPAGGPAGPDGLPQAPDWERNNRYTIPLAEARLREATAGRRLAREEVEYQVRSAHLDLVTVRETADLLEAAITAAAEGLRLAQLRYEAGLAINLEVHLAELALQQATADQMRAEHDHQLAKAKYRGAFGPGYRSAGMEQGGATR